MRATTVLLPLLVFCLSGFAALLYQVIWQRLLVIFSGADVYSVTIIVAAFMGGLGIGSLAGGHLADRLDRRRNLLLFAAAEIGVGGFGLLSKSFYYDTLYLRFSHLAATPAIAAVVLFITLLLPTFLMGLSLPLLARALAEGLGATPRVIGALYGWNTLGAALGAFAAPWILIPRLGLDRSLWVAATVNVLCALLAIVIARRQRAPVAHASEVSTETAIAPMEAHAGPFGFRTWVFVYGLTGFIALGLEIAWFRLLGVLLKSTAFTFGTLLAVYLGGLGAGAALGARLVGRSRRASVVFVGLQLTMLFYAALSLTGLMALLAAGKPAKLVRFLASYDPLDIYGTLRLLRDTPWSDVATLTPVIDLALLYIVVPAIFVGPPTLLMGVSFPYLQKATQTTFPHIGRRLGTLLAANIAGGVLGAALVGWLLLPAFGTAGTLKTLVLVGATLTWIFAAVCWPQRRKMQLGVTVALLLALGLGVLTMPNGGELWSRLHATTRGRVLFDEDGAGLSLLKMQAESGAGVTEVYVNGLGQSWLPYSDIQTALGALPVFIHPAPHDVALIGLGSGATAFAAAGRAEVQQLVSIEILGAQRQTLQRFALLRSYPGVVAVLTNSRIEHVVADGRAYLAHAGRQFDIIEADALRPSSAYAGNLYSREYFELLRRHLKPGGLAVTWAPTELVRATFLAVFPHVWSIAGQIYVGSRDPIDLDIETVLARADRAREYYARADIDIVRVLRTYLQPRPRWFGPTYERRPEPLNTDMFPRDEFALPF